MQKKDKWKILFFLLLSFVILTLASLLILVNLPVKDNKDIKNINRDEIAGFNIQTNKEDLNVLINRYLNQEGFKGSINYDVLLKDDVELYGTLPAFGNDLELKLTFEPKALKNGDLLLKQKSISVGQMKLPVSYVLNIVNNRFKTPEWVIIQPNDKLIYVSLQNMELDSGLQVKAKKFDLKHDDISFRLMVPPEK
ncbi:uncharacterized protein YpmS [Peribacillus deserti]|uniref:Uncharacterized protein YpmS n=1 Tax=Peribacillus deserti TaxID=673318 RepID=A0ABS2QII3_9BACI|nr:YpmS family protein [Peribacillus deserti]MBM7692539.1 uncharacterized protein YpmS [Peribacillus deserti]